MMLQPSKMLVFDEPTNHLDVPMKARLGSLEAALLFFLGGGGKKAFGREAVLKIEWKKNEKRQKSLGSSILELQATY